MNVLGIALIVDGTSDKALLSIVRWMIQQHFPGLALLELGIRSRVGEPLGRAVEESLALWSPDVLFVHRDAEAMALETRRAQIPVTFRNTVRVVPVRMTEAWLLFDESAIRAAAGNPNGSAALHLPRVPRLEQAADPKKSLYAAITTASERTKRRRKRLERDLGLRVQRVAESIADFAPLRSLPSFRAFEEETRSVVGSWLGSARR